MRSYCGRCPSLAGSAGARGRCGQRRAWSTERPARPADPSAPGRGGGRLATGAHARKRIAQAQCTSSDHELSELDTNKEALENPQRSGSEVVRF